eukprot:TRINITY_DN46878_c0_g1_i1.p1 TRINITY_DN46878_c0_g1~~TRINITY_DN46878_c0_g1_i1.p1  ORF type:complete len:466 (-),score=89.62 TRINITY_DN46878_c0_g1_i1:542-1756(-)
MAKEEEHSTLEASRSPPTSAPPMEITTTKKPVAPARSPARTELSSETGSPTSCVSDSDIDALSETTAALSTTTTERKCYQKLAVLAGKPPLTKTQTTSAPKNLQRNNQTDITLNSTLTFGTGLNITTTESAATTSQWSDDISVTDDESVFGCGSDASVLDRMHIAPALDAQPTANKSTPPNQSTVEKKSTLLSGSSSSFGLLSSQLSASTSVATPEIKEEKTENAKPQEAEEKPVKKLSSTEELLQSMSTWESPALRNNNNNNAANSSSGQTTALSSLLSSMANDQPESAAKPTAAEKDASWSALLGLTDKEDKEGTNSQSVDELLAHLSSRSPTKTPPLGSPEREPRKQDNTTFSSGSLFGSSLLAPTSQSGKQSPAPTATSASEFDDALLSTDEEDTISLQD